MSRKKLRESKKMSPLRRHMVRDYGHDGNVSRGERKKQSRAEGIPCILQPDESSSEMEEKPGQADPTDI